MHRQQVPINLFSPEKKSSGGLFGIGASTFFEYQVTTVELGWDVKRRFADFVWLRNYLTRIYPTLIIPCLPVTQT